MKRRIKNKIAKRKGTYTRGVNLSGSVDMATVKGNTRKQVNEANRRLRQLYKLYGRDKWAGEKVKKLKHIKGAVTSQGYLKTNKFMSDYDIITITKLASEIVESQLSTRRGIERYKKRTTSRLENEFEDFEDKGLSDDWFENFSKAFENTDILEATRYIDASTLFNHLQKASSTGESLPTFLEWVNNYVDTETDADVKALFIRIYNEFVAL